jgi:hypothetical protein
MGATTKEMFGMTTYERTGQGWKDDPAEDVVRELLDELSEHLGTDGPAETFGHPAEGLVGHLVDQPEMRRNGGMAHDAVALDTHDLEGLTVEEMAMHYIDEETEAEEPLPEELLEY